MQSFDILFVPSLNNLLNKIYAGEQAIWKSMYRRLEWGAMAFMLRHYNEM